eukprot:scaffold128557_cov17-Prasinocladus_malaysianus.AAC.1
MKFKNLSVINSPEAGIEPLNYLVGIREVVQRFRKLLQLLTSNLQKVKDWQQLAQSLQHNNQSVCHLAYSEPSTRSLVTCAYLACLDVSGPCIAMMIGG